MGAYEQGVTGLLTEAALREFEKFLDANVHQGLWRFEKELRNFIKLHGWEAAIPLDDKIRFSRQASSIRIFAGRRSNQTLRLQQLRDGNYRFWVYRASGCEAHTHLDGIAVAVEDPFWDTHFPANGWRCGCAIYGARNENGIRRVGGDPSKPLPDNWRQIDPATGVPWGIDPGFVGPVHPNMRFCIEGMMQGHIASY